MDLIPPFTKKIVDHSLVVIRLYMTICVVVIIFVLLLKGPLKTNCTEN